MFAGILEFPVGWFTLWTGLTVTQQLPFVEELQSVFWAECVFLRDSSSKIKCQHWLDGVNGEANVSHKLNPSRPPHRSVFSRWILPMDVNYYSRSDAQVHNSSETELQWYKGSSRTKVKAHENAVKPYWFCVLSVFRSRTTTAARGLRWTEPGLVKSISSKETANIVVK